MKSVLMLGNANSIHFIRWYGFLKSAGLSVSVLSLTAVEKKNRESYSEETNFYDFSKYSRFKRFIKVVSFLKRHNFDYVNIHYFRFSNALQSFMAKQNYIFTCWGSDILINYRKSAFIKKAVLSLALRKAYAITCDSTSVSNLLIEKADVKADKIKLIFWGVDTAHFKPLPLAERTSLRDSYKLPGDAIVILSIRNLKSNYNIDRIIDWFNRSIVNDKIYLYIKVPPERDQLYLEECKKVAENNRRIIFSEEYTPYEKLNRLYQMADINIHFPQSDATPVSMLEALSCGNSIIASEKIEAYKELSATYNITLTQLDRLSEDMICEIVETKALPPCLNREATLEKHSLDRTVKSIKELFK